MKVFFRCAAAAVLFASAGMEAQAAAPSRELVSKIAEATALSEYCTYWTIDSAAVTRILHRRNMQRDGRYRDIFGPVYVRAHKEGKRGGDFPAACDKAMRLYGPEGQSLSGLLRPVWHGACGDCQGAHAVDRPFGD